MANRIRDPQRERFWRDVLARFRAAGLTVRDFCRRERLSEPSFYAWRRTIAERDRPPGPKRRRRAPQPSQSAGVTRKRPAFLPLVMRSGLVAAASGIALELRGGRVLRFPESMPPGRLVELVHALEAAEAVS